MTPNYLYLTIIIDSNISRTKFSKKDYRTILLTSNYQTFFKKINWRLKQIFNLQTFQAEIQVTGHIKSKNFLKTYRECIIILYSINQCRFIKISLIKSTRKSKTFSNYPLKNLWMNKIFIFFLNFLQHNFWQPCWKDLLCNSSMEYSMQLNSCLE